MMEDLIKAMEHAYTQDIEEFGKDLMLCGLAQWEQYDDEGTFIAQPKGDHWFVADTGEEVSRAISYSEFAKAHYDLIFCRRAVTEHNVAMRWIDWIKDIDDYDATSCDFVLQILLYGEVIYS